jgi:hypothetical protein
METAVEWLVEHLTEYGVDLLHHEREIQQAKEMFEEQICKFASDYVETKCSANFDGWVVADMSTEEYYNLTFKSE